MPEASDYRYGIAIRTWRGGLGGVHYYGTVWKCRHEHWKYDKDERVEEHRVVFKLDADDAAVLNAKDSTSWLGGVSSFRHKAGDSCERYLYEEKLVEDALVLIDELWGHKGTIEEGLYYDCESPLIRNAEGVILYEPDERQDMEWYL